MKFSLEELYSYMKCPLDYSFRYRHKLPEISLQEEFSKELHKLFYHFFYGVMNREIPSLTQLKHKWESMWFRGMDPMEYMLTPQTDWMAQGQKALPLIENFYDQNCLNPGAPLAIDLTIPVIVDDHEISVHIDLVRELQNGPRRVIEIIDFKTGSQAPNKWSLDNNDLNLTMQSYAFRQNFNAKETKLAYHLLKNGTVYETYRGAEHYQRMNTEIKMLIRGISDCIFYPRESYFCGSCNYRDYCARWK